MLPKQLNNRIEIVGNVSERLTRQAENIAIQFRRTSSTQKSLFYEGVKVYNALLIELKQNEKIELFKCVKRIYCTYCDRIVRHLMNTNS